MMHWMQFVNYVTYSNTVVKSKANEYSVIENLVVPYQPCLAAGLSSSLPSQNTQ